MRFPSSIRTVAKSFRYRHCGWGWSGQSDIPSSPIWQLASCADKHSDDTEKLLTDKTQTADAGCRGTAGQSTALVHMGKIVEERIMSDDKVGEPDRSRHLIGRQAFAGKASASAITEFGPCRASRRISFGGRP